jgi:hypothetical protein
VNIANAVVAANARNFASLKLGPRTMQPPAVAPAIPISIIMIGPYPPSFASLPISEDVTNPMMIPS